jgi:hypothetical protein
MDVFTWLHDRLYDCVRCWMSCLFLLIGMPEGNLGPRNPCFLGTWSRAFTYSDVLHLPRFGNHRPALTVDPAFRTTSSVSEHASPVIMHCKAGTACIGKTHQPTTLNAALKLGSKEGQFTEVIRKPSLPLKMLARIQTRLAFFRKSTYVPYWTASRAPSTRAKCGTESNQSSSQIACPVYCSPPSFSSAL